MAQRERALLRKWFGKGCYPTAAQFSDWLDSFWHKAEQIAISSIEGLADRLNGKFEASSGEELARQHEQLKKDFDAHERDAKNDFRQLFDNVNELEAEDERLAGVIASETTRATEEEAAIRQEFAVADTQEQTDAGTKGCRNASIGQRLYRHHPTRRTGYPRRSRTKRFDICTKIYRC